MAVLMLLLPHTLGASWREAVLTHCTTPLSTCERVRCQRHICVSDLPTALREVYLLSPTVLWLLCGCGSPCPNGPKVELFRWYCSGVRGPECQRFIHGWIMQHVFISQTKVMLCFFFISDDVAVTCLPPTKNTAVCFAIELVVLRNLSRDDTWPSSANSHWITTTCGWRIWESQQLCP